MIYRNPSITLHLAGLKNLGAWWGREGITIDIPQWRLYWNASPGAWIDREDGSRYEITPGVLHLLAPHVRGFVHCKGHPLHLYLHFTASTPFSGVRDRIWQVELSGERKILLEQALDTFGSFRGQAESLTISLAGLSLVAATLRQIPEEDLRTPQPEDPRIEKALRMMESSQRALRNGEMAEAVGMAENSFARLFRQQVGETPQAVSLAKRLDRAKTLLQYGEESIKEIAERCGFYDRYHFGRLFKEASGETPAAYRKAARKNH